VKNTAHTYSGEDSFGQTVAKVKVGDRQIGREQRLEGFLGQRKHVHHQVHAW